MKSPDLPILGIVLLDGAGIGLASPVLPSLLRHLSGSPDIGWQFSTFVGSYALMQFLCMPLLASWSDAFGRRPILFFSVAGNAVDYAFMAFAPTLAVLLVARCLAGALSANLAVAVAYIADVTEPSNRARAFGRLRACFGVGFLVGPVVGGAASEVSPRAPFVIAMILAAVNIVLVGGFLPEPGARSERTAPALNPFSPLRWAIHFRKISPLLSSQATLSIASLVGGTIWVIYVEDRFHWPGTLIGASLAAFGICSALSQAFATGPLTKRFGVHTILVAAMLADIAAYSILGVIQSGWLTPMVLPLLCIGGLASPALHSIIANLVDDKDQGKIQGVLSGIDSLVCIGGPFAITYLYFTTRMALPGAIWGVGAALYGASLALVSRALVHVSNRHFDNGFR